MDRDKGSRGGYQPPQPQAQPDRLTQVTYQVDQVRGIMQQNIEKTIERGANLEELDEKSAMLEQRSVTFSKNSRSLKNQMKWRYYRNILLILLILAVIIVLICWWAGAFN